ncbi:MAG: hypothetical protein J7641_06405 [Cyanobacteria bacterium SID2]|nr:hypothetical protein [Cyanobacteria bacterium SID2]MBP0003381.1 hypothetical protein [Cyanobacteria bacterium SBC]
MKRPSQLTRLVWDFYRENPVELKQLEVLRQCRVFRFWGVFYIRCQTSAVARHVIESEPEIEIPIQQLRLSKKIKVLVGRKSVATFVVGVDRSNSEVRERL